MLNKANRLTIKQFNTVMRNGRFVHSPSFSIRYIMGDEGKRFAPVAPQKLFKTAISRHIAKRKIYEALKPLIPTIKDNVWTIIMAKNIIDNTTSIENITSEIKNSFDKIGILVK